MHSFSNLKLTRRAVLRTGAAAAATPLFGLPLRAEAKGFTETHGLSSFGDLAMPAGFRHFPYVRPDAPKGGQLSQEAVATSFDSLNGFILSGNPATGLGMIFDTLMAGSLDEDNAIYGLVAESVEVSADKKAYRFHLRHAARFHDGSPLTAKDVA